MQKKTVKKVLFATLFVVFYFFYFTNVVRPQIESKFFAQPVVSRPKVTNPNYDLKKIYENPQSEEIFPKPTGIPSFPPTSTSTVTPTPTTQPSETPAPTAITTAAPTATSTSTPSPTSVPSPTEAPTSTPTPTTSTSSCDSVSFSQETSGSETIISVSGAWWLSVRANPNYASVDFDGGNKIIKLHFTNDSGTINIHTSGWDGAPICKTYDWTK